MQHSTLPQDLFRELDLDPGRDLAGTFGTQSGWLTSPTTPRLEIENPTTGACIATLATTHPDHYERLLQESQATFEAWRLTPAPKRGQAIRLIGEALRQHQDRQVGRVPVRRAGSLHRGPEDHGSRPHTA